MEAAYGADEAAHCTAVDAAVRTHLQAATMDLPSRAVLLGGLGELLKGTQPLVAALKTTMKEPPRVGLVFNGQVRGGGGVQHEGGGCCDCCRKTCGQM